MRATREGIAMIIEFLLSGAVALLLLVYLVYALIVPERF
jgi:K+-transporting ATPase KdpF subunit